ncbi:MAG TPA: STAS/SEC14 domain-containing protein [Balneolaceae bacterium]|nr:STAS/SEC14 domain-containing protein [Balneolaceae bacterium]
MISFIEFDSDNIVGMHVSDKLSDEDFDAIEVLLEERMREYDQLRLYVELEGYEGMSLKSYLKDFKMGIKHWDRFEKEAVVTRKEWISKLTGIADELFSEVKAFSFDEKEEAKEWVQE